MLKPKGKPQPQPQISGGFGGNGTPAVIDGRYMNLAGGAQGPMSPEEQFAERKQALLTGQSTLWGGVMQKRHENRMFPQAPGQADQENSMLEQVYGTSVGKPTRMIGGDAPLGNQTDVDTRFDPNQISAATGNNLFQDANANRQNGHHPAVKALVDYLTRGGR